MDCFKNRRILIVGDVGLDKYILGTTTRISPEAPVPVVDIKDRYIKLGLAANVALNVKSLGGDPLLISIVGDDNDGHKICKLLEENGIDRIILQGKERNPTTTKARIICNDQHVVRLDTEIKDFISKETEKRLLQRIKEEILKSDAVIVEDYAKGVLKPSLLRSIINLGNKHAVPVIVDPNKNTPLSYYKGAYCLTPNLDETKKLNPRSIMRWLNLKGLIVTKGSEGITIYSRSKKEDIPSTAKKVVDVTGAGDTFVAAFTLALVSGNNFRDSAIIANEAAGISVGQLGCGVVRPQDFWETYNV